MKIIHLSDLHITSNKDSLENQMSIQLQHAIIKKYENERVVIVITGDVTNNGKESEYDNAITTLKPLQIAGHELVVCPGNHDYGKKGIHLRNKSQDLFFEKIEKELLGYSGTAVDMPSLYPKKTLFTEGGIVLWGIDSTEGRMDNKWNLHLLADGEVGEEQRNQITRELSEENPDDFIRVVYLHNHPWQVIPGHSLVDGSDFIKAIKGNVDLLLFGHYHTSQFWENKDGMLAMNAGKSTDPFRLDGKYFLGFREINIIDKKPYIANFRVSIDKKFIVEGPGIGDVY